MQCTFTKIVVLCNESTRLDDKRRIQGPDPRGTTQAAPLPEGSCHVVTEGRHFIAAESQRLAAVIPIITGTVKKHNVGPVCCRPLCEACLKISAGINCFLYSRANQGSAAPCNRRRGCNGKGGSTEECRMRLVSKELSDCFFRVPGVLILLRDKST